MNPNQSELERLEKAKEIIKLLNESLNENCNHCQSWRAMRLAKYWIEEQSQQPNDDTARLDWAMHWYDKFTKIASAIARERLDIERPVREAIDKARGKGKV